MKTPPMAIAMLIAAALMLTGCDAHSAPVTQPTITVPDELTPTNVPEPQQKLDAACASSWVKFERALTQFDAASAEASHDAGVAFDADEPFAVAPDAPGAADYYASLSDLTSGFGDTVVNIAAGIENARVHDALTKIGEGHIDAGAFLATYTDATTDDDLTRFHDEYSATVSEMLTYASLCGETLSGGTSDS